MRVIAIIAGSVLTVGLSAVPLSAASAGGTEASMTVTAAQDKPAEAKTNPSRRVCRMIIPSGSRLGQRSCRSRAEWDEQERLAQKLSDKQRRYDETVRPPSGQPRF